MPKPSKIPFVIITLIVATGLMLLLYHVQPFGVGNYPILSQVMMWASTILGGAIAVLLIDYFLNFELENYILNRILSNIITMAFLYPWVLLMIDLFLDLPMEKLLSGDILSSIALIYFVIAIPPEFVLYLQNKHWAPLQNDKPITACPLNKQLPPALHGAMILGLRADDHYVHIITDKGTHMMLATLSDCITQTDPMDGLQVHRSYWVARFAVKDISRLHGRYQCTLTDGTIIPISRSGIATIRDAEWIF